MENLKPWQIRIPSVCERCGKPFMAIRQLVLRGKGRFCTVRCSKLQNIQTRQQSVSLGGGYRGVWSGVKTYKREHVVIAERALGHPLPKGATVHHVDENKSNNANTNLVICENNSYHKYLHRLQAVANAGFDPHLFRPCWGKCKTIKAKAEFYKNRRTYDGLNQECKACANERTGWAVRKRQGRI